MAKDNLEQEIQEFLPLMQERWEEIGALKQKVENIDWKVVSESERYYPVRFFAEGLSAYVYVFNNAAVFYAWAAIEHALLIKLGAQRLRQAVIDNDNRYPGEKKLVQIARNEGIISRNIERVAHRVRKLRNNYIHYINIMWDQHDRDIRLRKMTDSQWPKIIKEIQDMVPSDKQAEELARLDFIKKDIESNRLIQKRQIPYIPGDPPNLEGRRFRNLRIKQFADWIRSAGDIEGQLKRYEYGLERKDALDCLQWSADLLAYLNFLQK